MKRKTNLKTVSIAAMLCALAYVLMLYCRIPVVLFLKYDPKDIIITLGGFIWGPWMALLVSAIVSFVEMIHPSETGFIGLVMNILSTCSFACTASMIYKKMRTLKGAVLGLIAGSIAMVSVMILWNYLITPLYMDASREEVAALIIPAFLPFNVLKAGLNAAFTFLLYRPIVTALRKARLVDESKSDSKKRFPVGLFVIAGLLIVTCVLFILSLRGII